MPVYLGICGVVGTFAELWANLSTLGRYLDCLCSVALCVCVCVFVCLCVCLCVCVYACVLCMLRTCVTHVCVSADNRARAHERERARARDAHTTKRANAPTHPHTHTPTHPHARARTYTNTHTHTHTQASDLAAAMPEVYGPGTLRTYLLDQLYLVSSETLTQRMKVQEVPAE